jgi:hypothetical protein
LLHGAASGSPWPSVIAIHRTTATDTGAPSGVIRLSTITAILVSIVCAFIFQGRRREAAAAVRHDPAVPGDDEHKRRRHRWKRIDHVSAHDAVQLECADSGWGYSEGYGCMGRPFLEEGRVVAAAVLPRAGRVRGPLPNLSGLDPPRRAQLAQFWVRVGLAEHASIAEFHRIALELMRFGAPTALMARAQLAAVDEARHARRCFDLASAYAGQLLEPGPLPIAATVVLAPDLSALANATARDGCVAETCSAWLFDTLGRRARDPAVKRVIEGVVRDETRHAELAWATLRWAISRGGRDVRDAAWQALAAPPPAIAVPGADDLILAAHGWAPGPVQDAITLDVWRRLVLPLGHQLCA